MQGNLQQPHIGGEILIKIIVLAEVNDEDLVLWIARPNQIENCAINLVAFIAHGSGIIHHDSHGYWNVLTAERGNGLRHSVFKYRKCVSIQIRHQVPLAVEYSGVEHDLLDFFLEHEH